MRVIQNSVTKRYILIYEATIYDPLGLMSLCHVKGKGTYYELCDQKVSWNVEVPLLMKRKF